MFAPLPPPFQAWQRELLICPLCPVCRGNLVQFVGIMCLGAAAEMATMVGISGFVLHGIASKEFQETHIGTLIQSH